MVLRGEVGETETGSGSSAKQEAGSLGAAGVELNYFTI